MADDPAELFHALMSCPPFQAHTGRILPVGVYGFQLILRPFMQNSQGFGWATNIINKANWLVSNQTTSSNGDEVFLLEPSYYAKPALGQFLYHVTPIANVSGILANGILPKTGGTTWLGRTYPARSHYALTLWDAMCFLDTTASKQPSIGGPGILTAAQVANYEIVRFLPPSGVDFWFDAWMTGACWTDATIPHLIVSLVRNWRRRYRAVALWR